MTTRSAILSVWLVSACVGAPPAPPIDHDGTTTDVDPTTGTTAPQPETSTSNDGTGSGSEDTGPSFDTVCGDGIVEAPEECDLGPQNGTGMYCTDDCLANTCGDGYVGPGEACDDGNDSNEDLCSNECGPTSCGDGVVQGSEGCDEGEQNSASGACLPSCIEASCGDTFIHEGAEVCDADDVGAETCESQGFDGGVLLCGRDCSSFDTSNCFACGDGVLNPGESCDGANLDGQTCVSQGFDGGNLVCTASCTLGTSGCYVCGNGVQEPGEDCDGADLGGASCGTLMMGYSGMLSCGMACEFDLSGCCLGIGLACMADGDCCSGNCSNATDLCAA